MTSPERPLDPERAAETNEQADAARQADFVAASHAESDKERKGAGCFLGLAVISAVVFVWKWWDVGQAEQLGRSISLHAAVMPFYKWFGRPAILVCGGSITLLFSLFAVRIPQRVSRPKHVRRQIRTDSITVLVPHVAAHRRPATFSAAG